MVHFYSLKLEGFLRDFTSTSFIYESSKDKQTKILGN